MKKRMTLKAAALTAVLILMAAAVPLAAQTEADNYENEAPFVRELALRLAERGWTPEPIREMVQASHSFQWSGIDPDVADLTAYALQKGLGKAEPGFEASPRIQAQLALGVAGAAMEMEGLGYGEQLIAQAAANRVLYMSNIMNEWGKEGNDNEETGSMTRDQTRNRIREQLMDEAERLQVRDQQKSGGSGRGTSQSAGAGRDSAPGISTSP